VEAPLLPSEAFNTIKEYCEDKDRLALNTNWTRPYFFDSVTLGLATLRDLILYRIPYREISLDILLQFAAHAGIIIDGFYVIVITIQ
jgi:hypothetical protein